MEQSMCQKIRQTLLYLNFPISNEEKGASYDKEQILRMKTAQFCIRLTKKLWPMF